MAFSKEKVISLRNTLKTDKNYPLMMVCEDPHTIISEANLLHFTIWDDANGVLYSLRPIDMQSAKSLGNFDKDITLIAVPYESISAMQVINLPITEIDAMLETIKASGCPISDAFKKRILWVYDQVFKEDRYRMSAADLNKIISSYNVEQSTPDAINAYGSYYEGTYHEKFKETIGVKRGNGEV